MVITKTHPETMVGNSLSIDITPELAHEFRKRDRTLVMNLDILEKIKHLATWELEFLMTGRLPSPEQKMTIDKYFSGSNRLTNRKSLNSL